MRKFKKETGACIETGEPVRSPTAGFYRQLEEVEKEGRMCSLGLAGGAGK